MVSTEAVDALIQDPAEFRRATERSRAWYRFVGDLYQGLDDVQVGQLASVYVSPLWRGELGVVALDSSWRATGAEEDQDRSHLLISESDAVRALGEIQSADICVATFHHPLHWLADWNHSALRAVLERRNTIVLTGHEHVADAQWVRSRRGEAVYLPTACLYQGSRKLPIAFSIIDIDPRDRTVKLQIRSWKESRGEFDRANEYLPNGEQVFDLPTQRSTGLAVAPRYTEVTRSLAETAFTNNSFAELVSDADRVSLVDLVVEPRLFPAPFSQIATTALFSQSQDKRLSSHLATVKMSEQLDEVQVGVVSGEALSGVTSVLLWLLGDRFERDALRIPTYFKFERAPGRDPMGRLVRQASRSFGVSANPDHPLPPMVVAIDDVETGDSRALARLVAHIRDHPDNRYIIGCHDQNGQTVSSALLEAGVTVEQGHLGPFGLKQLKQLVDRVGGGEAAAHVHHIMKMMFGEHLPRSPFVLSAVIAVLSSNPSLRPRNESKILEAVISLLLGKFNPSDTEAGIDARGREDLVQEFARHFILSAVDRISRRDAELFVAQYFDSRGIEGSASPGNHLNALIERRIMIQDHRGVGFRHRPFQEVVAATLMRVNPQFADEVLSDAPRNAAVVRHAAWLGRDDGTLLTWVGDVTTPEFKCGHCSQRVCI